MTENPDRIPPSYSPDKLLVSFTKSRFMPCLLMAVAAHVILIAAMSIGYINDHWIDPEGAAQRKAELAALTNRLTAAPVVKPAGPSDASNIVSGVSTAAAGSGATGVATEAVSTAGSHAPADRTNTVIMKQITETAKPEEIPSASDGLGISIKDTNPQ